MECGTEPNPQPVFFLLEEEAVHFILAVPLLSSDSLFYFRYLLCFALTVGDGFPKKKKLHMRNSFSFSTFTEKNEYPVKGRVGNGRERGGERRAICVSV